MQIRRLGVLLLLALICLGLVHPVSRAPGVMSVQRMNRFAPLGEVPVDDLQPVYVEGGLDFHVPAPQQVYDLQVQRGARIEVNYVGNWPPAARAAFEFATKIWELYLVSPVVITVLAEWKPLPSPFTLGGAMAADYYRDEPEFPYARTWYPSALANQLAGRDLNPSLPDIKASFNSSFSFLEGWYFATDGRLNSQQFDFVSVVLHELGHGLGVAGSMKVSDNIGAWGYDTGFPFAYDRYVVNNLSQSVLDVGLFPNSSRQLGSQLTGSNLFFNSSQAIMANAGAAPKLYAPYTWKQGSSFSHLDETIFRLAAGDALMTPNLANGESVHDTGGVALGIFQDMGWRISGLGSGSAAERPHRVYFPVLMR